MKYLTVSQYKNANEGLSLTGLSDRDIASFILKAETDIDNFMGFDLKTGGFEPHATWIQARFDERTRRITTPNTPVPTRQILRYRIQVSNLTSAGAGFFANILPTDCAINMFENYVEIVPLQSINYSLAPALLQLGLRPPIIQMDTEIGFYIPVYGDMLYLVSGTTNVYAGLRAFWASAYTQSLATQPNMLPPVPPVIYVDGVVASPSTYTINYTEGNVTFPSLTGTHTITADFTYTIPDTVRNAAISRTNYHLIKRRLNQLGLTGLETIKTGDQEIQAPRLPRGNVQGVHGILDDDTAMCLFSHVEIPIA
jgi:hypothetical protein